MMLNKLSTELIEHIAFSLEDRSDLLTLRRVCQRLKGATSRAFARAWFGTIVVDFTPRCLRRVADIAHQELLRENVRHIEARTSMGCGGSGSLDLASPSAKDTENLLASFSNCAEITVTDIYPKLAADGLFTIRTLNFMFLVIDRLRIKIFRIIIRNVQAHRHVDLLLDTINSEPFRASWSHIRHLIIHWQPTDEPTKEVIEGLITRARSLQTLELKLILFKYNNELLYRLAETLTLPAITHLEFRAWRPLSPLALSRVIIRFKESMVSLRLGHIHTEWNDFFTRLSKENFPHLKSITVDDTHSAFFCPLRMNQDALSRCGGKFEFTLIPVKGRRRVNGVRYRGTYPEMQLALKTLGDNSSYDLSLGDLSPRLFDMQANTEDAVGEVVEIFL